MTISEEKSNCRLCEMVNRIREMPAKTEAWKKEIAIEDGCGRLRAITLRGVTYSFEDGKQETVRLMHDRWVLVNPVKDYSYAYKDVVIAIPYSHLTNREFVRDAALYTQFDGELLDFVEKEYQGMGARIMMNDGRYASVMDHAHKQIIQVDGTQTIIPGIIVKY